MARLNEPPVSTDNFETLRRKFLRQNRDIARVNSSQSLRIRGLENECARLLSENLDLRGQIARLEKELDESSAQRIADHALDIKAKLEAQLIEWGSLLAGLGLEPPMKRHSPSRRRISKPRPSLGRSPAARKTLRNAARDAEALAAEEARLPPIPENRLYPRQTLNREEILALCSEAADSTDSPDLGPPPVSRFVDEDPIKLDSPCRPSDGDEGTAATRIPESPKAPPSPVPVIPAKLDFSKRVAADPEKKKQQQRDAALPSSQPQRPAEQQQPASQPPRAGSKRKLGVRDENENVIGNGTRAANNALSKLSTDIVQGPRDLKTRKSIKDISASRAEARDRTGPVAITSSERRPLAAKSTNDDVSSPRKAAKAARPPLDETAAAKKIEALKAARMRDRQKEPVRAAAATATAAAAAAAAVIATNLVVPEPQPEPEPATPLIDTNLSAPDTPQQSVARDPSRDTPPPADISSHGETSRPSRRARASVSYAEPSLRAKMRRPTKELLDAVAGEGKYLQRQQKPDEVAPGISGASSAKGEPDEGDSAWKRLPAAAEAAAAARRHSVLSPLAQKEPAAAENLLPSSVVTERRKRSSSFGIREGGVGGATGASMADLRKIALSHHHYGGDETSRSSSPAPADDPYEFNISSPAMEPRPRANARETSTAAARGGSKSSSSSRQLSSSSSVATMQDVSSSKVSKPSGPRKRASMAAPKKTASMLDDDGDDVDDDSYEPPARDDAGARELSARDRISRRRSMML